jgi:thioredoxin reductase
VAGEDQAKVVYRLIDAEQYQGQHVLVVGGGDSALEAAIALSEQADVTVQLSYRGDTFNRVKTKNREALEQAVSAGRLELLLGTQIEAIEAQNVRLRLGAEVLERANDAVIVCAGGVLPTDMLKQIGIAFETKYGEA